MAHFTTEYRSNNTQLKNKGAYHEITPAGKSRYLARPVGKGETLKSGMELKQADLDEKIKGVWKVVEVNPQLKKEQFEEESEVEVQLERKDMSPEQVMKVDQASLTPE